ncbi:hypothetical protein BGX26_007848 [Mortierella sp. AD094]|nr:hypothetical protein BGX26_007848 [Mortierella sp. AD094]
MNPSPCRILQPHSDIVQNKMLTRLSQTSSHQRQYRAALKEKYEIWRRNDGLTYWATVAAASQIQVTTKRTVADIVSGCEHVAKDLIQENSDSMGQSALAVPLSDPANSPREDYLTTKKVKFLETEFATDSEQSDHDHIPDSNSSSARSFLNSIDFSFVNRLVGPGTTSSRLKTTARLFVGQFDISETLMTARRAIVKKQSETISIPDLLTLNFIFSLAIPAGWTWWFFCMELSTGWASWLSWSEGLPDGWTKNFVGWNGYFSSEFLIKHLSHKISAVIMGVPVPAAAKDEIQILSECSLYAACRSFSETRLYIQDNTKAGTLIGDLLRAYTTRPGLWQDPSALLSDSPLLLRNEDTYMEVIVKSTILGVFGELDVVDHWTRDPLPTPQGFEEAYYPDYYAEKAKLPFMVVEVKKPEAKGASLGSDKRKLPCMMKIMLDQLLVDGVQDPVVIGFLINGRFPPRSFSAAHRSTKVNLNAAMSTEKMDALALGLAKGNAVGQYPFSIVKSDMVKIIIQFFKPECAIPSEGAVEAAAMRYYHSLAFEARQIFRSDVNFGSFTADTGSSKGSRKFLKEFISRNNTP